MCVLYPLQRAKWLRVSSYEIVIAVPSWLTEECVFQNEFAQNLRLSDNYTTNIWNIYHRHKFQRMYARELPLKQRPNPNQISNLIVKHTNLSNHEYIIDAWNLTLFRDKTVCNRNSIFKHIAWSTAVVAKEMTSAWLRGEFDNMLKQRTHLHKTEVEAIAILTSKITWWHANADFDWSRFKLFINRISVAMDEMCWYHGWICVVDINALGMWCQPWLLRQTG